MPSEKGMRKFFSVNPAITGNTSCLNIPMQGRIAEVRVGVLGAAPTSGVVAVTKGGTTILSGASVDLSGLTAATASTTTLATGPILDIATTSNMLAVVSTVTTTGSMTAICVTVGVDPLYI